MAAKVVSATLTVDASGGNYTANDVVSNSGTADTGVALTFTDAARFIGGDVTTVGLRALCSEDSVVWRLRVHFFNAAPLVAEVEMDDNAAFSILTAAGAAKWLGSIDLPAMRDDGVVAVAENDDIYKVMQCAATDKDLYVVVQTLDAETNETAGMTIRFDMYVEHR